jgi:hypothetical protein
MGCESQQSTQLPNPNFNGPVVVAQQAPPPVQQYSQPAPRPVAPKAPLSKYVGNVPREWIPMPGAKRDWYWIVIHHSATPAGSVKDFDREHKEKGWDECGYHFVIGNGTNSGNGQIEVGPRWPKQKYGAHAKTPDNQYNEHGIGICLVGNFDIDRPTAAQMASLDKLVVYLMKTYNIRADHVLGHKQTKPTDCPGRNINIFAIRRTVQAQLAEIDGTSAPDPNVAFADEPVDQQPIAASAELLQDATPSIQR